MQHYEVYTVILLLLCKCKFEFENSIRSLVSRSIIRRDSSSIGKEAMRGCSDFPPLPVSSTEKNLRRKTSEYLTVSK